MMSYWIRFRSHAIVWLLVNPHSPRELTWPSSRRSGDPESSRLNQLQLEVSIRILDTFLGLKSSRLDPFQVSKALQRSQLQNFLLLTPLEHCVANFRFLILQSRFLPNSPTRPLVCLVHRRPPLNPDLPVRPTQSLHPCNPLSHICVCSSCSLIS